MKGLNISAEARKEKSILLILSAVSLFIVLTKSLPNKIGIIGIDLSGHEHIAGWFVFGVTVYFLIVHLVNSIVFLTNFFFPEVVRKRTSDTTGETIGLTASEIYPDYPDTIDQPGTMQAELGEIKEKNANIRNDLNRKYFVFVNTIRFCVQIAFPLLFGICCAISLLTFLLSI